MNDRTGNRNRSEKEEKNKKYANLQHKNARLKKSRDNARSTGIIYSHIAYALAQGCTDLFYVNVDTGEYIEYHTDDEHGILKESRRSSDFFESCKREAKLYVHPEDQEAFVNAMNREFLMAALDQGDIFRMSYRRIKDGRVFYVSMRVSRMEDDHNFIVISVFDVDELMMRRREEERIREERVVYARLHAITGNFLVVYVVDPESGSYHEFSSAEEYQKNMELPKEGENFFETIRDTAEKFTHPEDISLFLSAFTEENILSEIENSGIFTLGFRLMIAGRPRHVQMKAAMVEEKEGLRLIVGLNDIDVQVRQEERIRRRLVQAQSQAKTDALTGVKNKSAYMDAAAKLDMQIRIHSVQPFAVVVMDINDLKIVNDTYGHQAGDQYIRDACKIICDIFKHSPVFRIGGDEFAVIAQGSDYSAIEERLSAMSEHNRDGVQKGGIVIACGMANFEDDSCVESVFDRADHNMYENKRQLKS